MLPLLFALGFCTIGLLLACAVVLSRQGPPPDGGWRPPVSIVIATRNEEGALPDCLQSISRLTYPPSLLEVIVVDDGSTDRTGAMLRAHAAHIPFLRTIAASPAGELQGKVNTLCSGIEASKGELLMFTDADCTVPAGWVEETLRFYTDERVGLVAGFTLLEGRGLFARLQALDWLLLYSLAAAALRLHFPVTAVGNNLSVRRAAYDAVGGYRAIPFSVTEDFALFKAVIAGGWTARFPMHFPALARSRPCVHLAQLFAQKKRWFLGGVGMEGMRPVVFAAAYLFFGALVVTAASGDLAAACGMLGAKALADLLLLRPALRAFRCHELLVALPLYELYVLATTLFFPPLVLLHPRVTWKDRSVANAKAPR